MDNHDINNIISEITNLKKLGIVLSKDLDCDRIMDEFNQINDQLAHGRYVLPKMYSLIKRVQQAINSSLHNNDINLFIKLFNNAEKVRNKLGKQYQIRAEINSKVRNIRSEIQRISILEDNDINT
jgi:phosphomevalonate kinase